MNSTRGFNARMHTRTMVSRSLSRSAHRDELDRILGEPRRRLYDALLDTAGRKNHSREAGRRNFYPHANGIYDRHCALGLLWLPRPPVAADCREPGHICLLRDNFISEAALQHVT